MQNRIPDSGKKIRGGTRRCDVGPPVIRPKLNVQYLRASKTAIERRDESSPYLQDLVKLILDKRLRQTTCRLSASPFSLAYIESNALCPLLDQHFH
jgi:hypothetical protein